MLNELPNFKTNVNVDGFGDIELHFLHQQSPAPDAVPLLFVHGWPGSYVEVTKMLHLLERNANGVSFHVVAPSLPNFGWSAVTQGGDWGMYITRSIGLLYPESCLASHINMVRASPPKFSKNPLLALQHAVTPYTEDEMQGRSRSDWFANEGSGYRMIQSTKPQTVGYALADSPVALLAWIY
ncbi:alpha/beta-hydrolase, partial [Aureobasidium sp. EXF-8846]